MPQGGTSGSNNLQPSCKLHQTHRACTPHPHEQGTGENHTVWHGTNKVFSTHTYCIRSIAQEADGTSASHRIDILFGPRTHCIKSTLQAASCTSVSYRRHHIDPINTPHQAHHALCSCQILHLKCTSREDEKLTRIRSNRIPHLNKQWGLSFYPKRLIELHSISALNVQFFDLIKSIMISHRTS